MAVTDEQFAALEARTLRIEKNLGLTASVEESEEEAPTVPEDTFEVEGVTYKFALPTFYFKKTLYVSEELVADLEGNAALFAQIVASSTDSDDNFFEGILEIVESES